MKAKKEDTQPFEFSKVIFWLIFGLNLYVLIFSSIIMWHTMDLSPLAYIIPAESGVFATAVGFYYWKAKAENKLKLLAKYKITPTQETLDNIDNTNNF